jgi:hypothetical protein
LELNWPKISSRLAPTELSQRGRAPLWGLPDATRYAGGVSLKADEKKDYEIQKKTKFPHDIRSCSE